jgi:hypothetical protein
MEEGVGIRHHRAELQAIERFAIPPNASMPVDHRPSVADLYRERDNKEQWQQQKDRQTGCGDVENALGHAAYGKSSTNYRYPSAFLFHFTFR